MVKLYESLEAGEAKEGIDIKIPKCNDLKEYIQYMKDIDFILSQCPFISGSGEEIVFNTVDVGSMWFFLLRRQQEVMSLCRFFQKCRRLQRSFVLIKWL